MPAYLDPPFLSSLFVFFARVACAFRAILVPEGSFLVPKGLCRDSEESLQRSVRAWIGEAPKRPTLISWAMVCPRSTAPSMEVSALNLPATSVTSNSTVDSIRDTSSNHRPTSPPNGSNHHQPAPASGVDVSSAGFQPSAHPSGSSADAAEAGIAASRRAAAAAASFTASSISALLPVVLAAQWAWGRLSEAEQTELVLAVSRDIRDNHPVLARLLIGVQITRWAPGERFCPIPPRAALEAAFGTLYVPRRQQDARATMPRGGARPDDQNRPQQSQLDPPPDTQQRDQTLQDRNLPPRPRPGSVLTVGARAWTKHAIRDATGGWWGNILGSEAAKNAEAERILAKILDGAVWQNVHGLANSVRVYEVRQAEGYGARWEITEGLVPVFRGFVEPHMDRGWETGWVH